MELACSPIVDRTNFGVEYYHQGCSPLKIFELPKITIPFNSFMVVC
jgi:hypothetical protein